jgi:glycolate oxidase
VCESHARDASGLWLVPAGVLRPSSREALIADVRDALRSGTPVTMAGSQTSTTGASITERGLLVSTRALAGIGAVDRSELSVRVEPGVLLGDLNRALAADSLVFAPDPTSDQECTVGGAIACNASGPRTLRYGATRAHVRALTVLLADGRVIEVRRSALEKNTVGYAPVQEPIDWFIGSEGTLGVVVEAELALMPRPAHEVGLAIPFVSPQAALAFIVAARESDLMPRCLEYFDAESLAIVRQASPVLGDWSPDAAALVYAECDTARGDPRLDVWLALAEAGDALGDDVRVFDGEAAVQEARRLRHAVPSAMHERVGPYLAHGGRRVSTDWAVPYRRAAEAIARADEHARRAGVGAPVTYGHLGNGHPHQNFVARNADEVAACERAVEATLRDVVAIGGTVAAEHGIGKLKAKWLPLQLSELQRGMLVAIKRELDPNGLFAPGNLGC